VLVAQGAGGNYRITVAGLDTVVSGARWHDDVLSARFDGLARRFTAHADAVRIHVHDGRHRLQLAPSEVYRREGPVQGTDDRRLQSPMPGRVVLVNVKPGDRVNAGQELLVIEAMKMELGLKAPRDGIVGEVRAAAGDVVEADAVLVTLEA